MNTKKCYRCNKEKPESDFLSLKPAALCASCRDYANDAARKWYADGKYKNYEEQREYRFQLFDQQLPEGQKRCRTCLNIKSVADFIASKGESKHCGECREKKRDWQKSNRDKWSAERKRAVHLRAKQLRDGRKKQVIDHYGGKCECCGETAIEFLSIDHKIKIGSKLRKENGEWGNKFYLFIVRNNFPDRYRCLCFNCNWSIGTYGYCPHQQHEQHPIDQALRTMPMVGMVN